MRRSGGKGLMMFLPGNYTSMRAYAPDEYTTNLRFRVWSKKPPSRPGRRLSLVRWR